MSIKVYTSVSSDRDYVGWHNIIQQWEETGKIERIQIAPVDSRFISWVGRVNGLAIEPSDARKITQPYEYAMCCQYRSNLMADNPRIIEYNMWVRDFFAYRDVINEPIEKTNESIFSGTIRGGSHSRNLWKNSTTIWGDRPARTYNRTNDLFPTIKDYYRALAGSKFALCLAGDGGEKSCCQREVESMLFNCIPIFDKGVCTDWYGELAEGTHYLRADNPEQMHELINTISNEQVSYMRQEIEEYAEDYLTPAGLWSTVLEVIQDKGIKI